MKKRSLLSIYAAGLLFFALQADEKEHDDQAKKKQSTWEKCAKTTGAAVLAASFGYAGYQLLVKCTKNKGILHDFSLTKRYFRSGGKKLMRDGTAIIACSLLTLMGSHFVVENIRELFKTGEKPNK